MSQKVIRSPFAGIDFSGENNNSAASEAKDPGPIINFNNDTPSFPVELPPKPTVAVPRQPVQQPFPVNFSLPSQNQELSGNISLIGGGFAKPGNPASVDVLNEPPLLEDLGIDIENIKNKTLSVLNLKKCDEKIIKEADMSGPLLFALIFGSLLMLSGKIHFGYIYGFGIFGCLLMYFLMNFISQSNYLELYNTISILGYCLLPIVFLSGVNAVIDLKGFVGIFLAMGAIAWASMKAASFFQTALDLHEQRWIVVYPSCLFYSTFVLITIF